MYRIYRVTNEIKIEENSKMMKSYNPKRQLYTLNERIGKCEDFVRVGDQVITDELIISKV